MHDAELFHLDDLAEFGDLLRAAAIGREDFTCLLPVEVRRVVRVAAQLTHADEAPVLSEGFALVVAHWHADGTLAPSSQARLAEVLSHAVTRAERLGVERWDDDFDDVVCSRFIQSRIGVPSAPSISTMHLRRSALRAGFSTLRGLGLFSGDPTLDLALPPRSQLSARAAGDDEIALVRLNAIASRESRQPTVLALAETTATTSEIPRITTLSFDDPIRPTWVALPGGRRTRPRPGRLSEWGSRVVAGTLRDRRKAGIPDDQPLVYFGDKPGEASPQASVCRALHSIMRRAGLAAEQDLSPRSIGYWAGRQAFDAAATAKLEAAARAMGITSLDRAAKRIDYSWDDQ